MKNLFAAAAIVAGLAVAGPAFAGDGGPTGAFQYSTDHATAQAQKEAKSVVERYQAALNTSDFDAISREFAPDAVAEWNEKTTMIGVDAMRAPYEALFKTTKFSTDFQFDAVDIHYDIAIVRTHHPVGQTELNLADNSKKLDFNREIFVLKRSAGAWKIILYTFNTQPEQGEQ